MFRNLSNRELSRSGSLSESVVADSPGVVQLAERVHVLQAEGPIVFGTSEAFIEAAEEESDQDTIAIIIRATRVPLIDQTGAFTIQEFIMKMRDRGAAVIFSGLPDESAQVLRRLQIIPNTITEQDLFPTFAQAVEGLNEKLGLEGSDRFHPRSYLHKVGG